MSKKQSETSMGVEPPNSDNLKLINGIGHAIERRLNDRSIYTYAQLAALSPADIAAAVADLAGFSAERIKKQDWIGQARKLALESKTNKTLEQVRVLAEPFVSQLDLADTTSEKTPIRVPMAKHIGVLFIRQVETIPVGKETPQNCLPYAQSFNVRLTLDLSNIKIPLKTKLTYWVSIYSKSLEEHSRQTIGESNGLITFTDRVTISVGEIQLPKGAYRLKAVVILKPMMGVPPEQPVLIASKECDLLLIF